MGKVAGSSPAKGARPYSSTAEQCVLTALDLGSNPTGASTQNSAPPGEGWGAVQRTAQEASSDYTFGLFGTTITPAAVNALTTTIVHDSAVPCTRPSARMFASAPPATVRPLRYCANGIATRK